MGRTGRLVSEMLPLGREISVRARSTARYADHHRWLRLPRADRTQRKALRLAEVLQMAVRQPLDLRRSDCIETRFVQAEPAYPVMTAALGAGALLAPGLGGRLVTKPRPAACGH